MPDRVNYNLGFRDFVENQVGVGRCRHSADRRIARAASDMRMLQQKIGEDLNAGLNSARGEWAAM